MLTSASSILKTSSYLGLAASAVFLSTHANAATVTGNIGVQIEIGSGCQINGHGGQSQPLDFGTIDFGQWMSLTATSPNIDADTTGSAGAGVVIECNTAAPYTITLDGGLHFSTTRRMLNTTTAGQYVSYNLYQEATRTNLWVPSTAMPFTSTGTSGTPVTTTHHFYGRVPSQVQANAGIYEDTVTVTVAW